MSQTSGALDTQDWCLRDISSTAYFGQSTETSSPALYPDDTEQLVVVSDNEVDDKNTPETQGINAENTENANTTQDSAEDCCIQKRCRRMRTVGSTRCRRHTEDLIKSRLRTARRKDAKLCYRCRSDNTSLNNTMETPSSEKSTGGGREDMICARCREADEIHEQRRTKRRETQMCTDCDKPSANFKRCADCRERARNYKKKFMAARRERLQQQGLCIQCSNETSGRFKTCESCRMRRRKVPLTKEAATQTNDTSDDTGPEQVGKKPGGLES